MKPNARVEFFCNEYVVCSIDEEHAVNIPLANFDFPPRIGQEIFLAGYMDEPHLCTDDLNDPPDLFCR